MIRSFKWILKSRFDFPDLFLNVPLIFSYWLINDPFIVVFLTATGLLNCIRLFWPKRPEVHLTALVQSLTASSWFMMLNNGPFVLVVTLAFASILSVIRSPPK